MCSSDLWRSGRTSLLPSLVLYVFALVFSTNDADWQLVQMAQGSHSALSGSSASGSSISTSTQSSGALNKRTRDDDVSVFIVDPRRQRLRFDSPTPAARPSATRAHTRAASTSKAARIKSGFPASESTAVQSLSLAVSTSATNVTRSEASHPVSSVIPSSSRARTVASSQAPVDSRSLTAYIGDRGSQRVIDLVRDSLLYYPRCPDVPFH